MHSSSADCVRGGMRFDLVHQQEVGEDWTWAERSSARPAACRMLVPRISAGIQNPVLPERG